MKNIIVFFVWFLICIQSVSAQDDYTLIDCVNGDNDSWIAFDSEYPYATLKQWIEQTIEYINTNINFEWNQQTASWQVFEIKVACSFYDILNPDISLNFSWPLYHNFLKIEWLSDDALVFKNVGLKLWDNAWNIIFKNANFLNESKPYFYDFIPLPGWYRQPKRHPFSYPIEIRDSYIQLKNFNLWSYNNYKSYRYKYYNRWYQDNLQNYSNKQKLQNSILDIQIEKDFTFRLPIEIRDSKINFSNTGTGVHTIHFLEDGNKNIHKNLSYSHFDSNQIDLWWNNFTTTDSNTISFINNYFENFTYFHFGGKGIFINNYIWNKESINISSFHNLFNNIFEHWFTDSYDIANFRRNFSKENISQNGIWWVYKRLRNLAWFWVDLNSLDLYESVTGKKLEQWLWEIFVIFNY